jgi:protein gp37
VSDHSKIEWTDATWSPVTGCTKVSPGCEHCYIERTPPFRKEHRWFDRPGIGGTTGVRLHEDRLAQPLRWTRPRRVFVCSLADLFHDDVPDGYIARVWDVMGRCPQHTFQILTKRPARLRSWLTRWADTTGDAGHDRPTGMPPLPRGPEAVRATYTSGRARLFADMLDSMGDPPEGCAYPLYDWMEGQRFWPAVLPNVWVGVTVESQQWADIRVPELIAAPAAVRWVSAEPLLGPIDLTRLPFPRWSMDRKQCCGMVIDALGGRYGVPGLWQAPAASALSWVVCGGESGPKARPMHPDWARSLRDQCVEAGVPYLFKQWGEWSPAPWKLDRGPGETDDQYKARSDAIGATHAFTGGFYREAGRDVEGFEAMSHRPWSCERDSAVPPGAVGMRKVGKTRAGRALDGRTWDQYPEETRT